MDRDRDFEELLEDQLLDRAASGVDVQPRYPRALCQKCKHMYNSLVWTCSAYPHGIPVEILRGDIDHHYPYTGDHGVQFESRFDCDVS